MTAEQFAYWLQGYAELTAAPPTAEQWQSIRDHLALVFNKITPAIPGFPATPTQWRDVIDMTPRCKVAVKDEIRPLVAVC